MGRRVKKPKLKREETLQRSLHIHSRTKSNYFPTATNPSPSSPRPSTIKHPPTLQVSIIRIRQMIRLIELTQTPSPTKHSPTTMSPAKTQPWKQWYGQVKNKTELGGHYIVEVATGRSSPPTNGGTILLTKGVDLSADKPRPMSE